MSVPKERQLLTLQELCERSRLSPATIHRLKKAGKIPVYQPSGRGGRLLFPADAIERLSVRLESAASAAPSERAAGHLAGPRPNWMNPRNK